MNIVKDINYCLLHGLGWATQIVASISGVRDSHISVIYSRKWQKMSKLAKKKFLLIMWP